MPGTLVGVWCVWRGFLPAALVRWLGVCVPCCCFFGAGLHWLWRAKRHYSVFHRGSGFFYAPPQRSGARRWRHHVGRPRGIVWYKSQTPMHERCVTPRTPWDTDMILYSARWWVLHLPLSWSLCLFGSRRDYCYNKYTVFLPGPHMTFNIVVYRWCRQSRLPLIGFHVLCCLAAICCPSGPRIIQDR